MIGKMMAEKRAKLDFTQEEVARDANITRAYYSLIESESKRPSPRVAQKIARKLGFDWTIFFTNECNNKLPTRPQE